MAFDRYTRGLIPYQAESLPDFISTELLKLQRTVDGIDTAVDLTNSTVGGLTAANVANVAAGTIAATNVQAALNELDTEKASLAGATFIGPITVPSPVTVGSSQVLTTRVTGWTADTGTAKRTANATYTAAAVSNPPTQAEVQAIANALQDVSQALKALKDDLLTHGLIGT
jgi:hypothetical protein